MLHPSGWWLRREGGGGSDAAGSGSRDGSRGREGVMGPGVANMKSSVLALLGECILI